MKKNGFTLIEIMAVIFILGIVMTLVIVSVDKTIKDNKESLYQVQIDNIEDAARTWGNAHINLIPDENGDAISIPLMILKQDGLVDKNLKNPKTEELFFDNMYIDISYENGQYIYDVIEDSGTKIYSDLSYPVIILKERFGAVKYVDSMEVLISTLDKQILNDTLTSTNNTTNKTLTLSYTESGKTFEVVRNKMNRCVLVNGVSRTIGSEYKCNPGDNVERTFYVIENNDTTVSLIMEKNINDMTMNWNDAKNYINSEEIFGKWVVDVALPTRNQIYNINNSSSNLPLWLTNNLDNDSSTSTPLGYWTSTAYNNTSAYTIYYYKTIQSQYKTSTTSFGVRPVINISKDDIN